MNQVSILGSLRKDFILFYGLTILIWVWLWFVKGSWDSAFMAFLVLFFIDAGHAHITIFRTYLRKEERQRYPWFYILTPIVVLLFMFSWGYFGWPYLWRFMLLMTFFHHIRQNYGLFMWYAKLENFKHAYRYKYHIYLLAVLPFILYLYRELDYKPLYQYSERYQGVLFPGEFYLQLFYFFYLFLTVIHILKNMWTKKMGMGLGVSFIFPAILNGSCFLLFHHSYEIFIPMLAFHGFSYMAMMVSSMKKLDHKERTDFYIWLWIIGAVFVLAGTEFMITDSFDIYEDPSTLVRNPILSLVMSLSVFPNLVHYIFDAVIWKKENPDFQMILKK